MSKKVTVYTTNTCAYCAMVKKYLDAKSVPYDVVNLDENPKRQAEVLELSGALTVPVTLVEDSQADTKEVIIGYNLAKLAPAVS